MAVTFDLFGTLVSVARPDDPAAAVARELDARGIDVPADWETAYRERHVDAPDGAEVPLPAHVSAALRSRGVDPAAPSGDDLTSADRVGRDPPDGEGDGPEGAGNVVRRAVVAAFDPAVTTREGAPAAVEAAAELGPVGVLSNCSVPGLARRALLRSGIDRGRLDSVVTSAGCGWRKPDGRAFAAVARRLGVDPSDLVHVGDDPRTDGGVRDVGGTAVFVAGADGDPPPEGEAVPLRTLPERLRELEGSACP